MSTKIRVHELAKELDVSSKDIMKKLETIGVFVPNHMSTLEPGEVNKVRGMFGKPAVKRPAPPRQAVRKAEAKPGTGAEGKPETPKTENAAPDRAKAEMKKEPPKPEIKSEPIPEKKPEAEPAETSQLSAGKSQLAEEKPQPTAEKPSSAAEKPQPENRAAAASQAGKAGNEAASRPAESPRNRDQQSRPQGQRSNSGERPARYSDQQSRPQGQRSNSGERPARYGDQQGRPQGQRPNSGDRPMRNGDQQGRSQGQSRPYGGERPNRSGDQNRQGQGGYRRASDQSGQGGARRPYDSQRNQGGARPFDAKPRGPRPAQGGSADTLIIPERPKIEEKPKKTDRNRKDKGKPAGTEEYGRKKSIRMTEVPMDDGRLESKQPKVKKPKAAKPQPVQETKPAEPEIKVVSLPEVMTVKEFAEYLKKPSAQIIKSLMLKGIMAGLNQQIEFEKAEEVALDMGILVEPMVEEDIFASYLEAEQKPEDPANLKERPPVVVVMGHVDHGKTSLLDTIRKTKVTAGEAGGITQQIGASVVEIDGRKITFLDTPGHEAFTAMRMRGAQVTDIAILVVAADDGVMPQTVEAINHAKAAGVDIIVAINKMDKPGANPDRVMQELSEYELIPEDWGGSTICVPVSALKGDGIDTLLEMVLLVADMKELKANPDKPAAGTIIEAELDKGRGAVATVLVQSGTLQIGDCIVVGRSFGKVKAMQDDKGRKVKSAGPSKPVEIIGLSEVPSAGERFFVTKNEKEARQLSEKVSAKDREKLMEGTKKVSLDDLFNQIKAGSVKELNIVVKADTQGAVEAVRQSLEKLSNSEVVIRIIHGGVGAVTESDVTLASASNSIIIGFNVRPDAGAKSVAEREQVDIRLYRVIYNAIEDIEAAMKGMLDPEFEEKVIGHAAVRQVFKASGIGTIAGSYVTDGKITRSASARLVRDGIVIHEGELASLRRFKDDVKEVASGYECGIMFAKYSDIREEDVIEAYVMEEIKR